MRKELLFSRQHPLTEFSCISMCLLNVRSWNGHIFSETRYAQFIPAYSVSQKLI